MEPYFQETLNCSFGPKEKTVQQWLHRDASRRFVEVLRASATKTKGARSAFSLKKDTIIYPTAEMRELLITTVSTRLRMFHDISKRLGTDTLVETLAEHRDRGFDGYRLSNSCVHKLA